MTNHRYKSLLIQPSYCSLSPPPSRSEVLWAFQAPTKVCPVPSQVLTGAVIITSYQITKVIHMKPC